MMQTLLIQLESIVDIMYKWILLIEGEELCDSIEQGERVWPDFYARIYFFKEILIF